MYLFVLRRLARKCTKIYNACRTTVRLIKPFALRQLIKSRFAAVVVCIRSLLLWCIKSHDVDIWVFCLRFKSKHEIIEKFQVKRTKLFGLSFFTLEKSVHSPMEIPEIDTGILIWSNGKRPLNSLISENAVLFVNLRKFKLKFFIEWKVPLISVCMVRAFLIVFLITI